MIAAAKQAVAETICARLVSEMHKLGFRDEELAGIPCYGDARFHTARDPYSGDHTLIGEWLDSRGHSVGSLKFHGDGTFYAEYDVVRPHPRDPRWFVEGVVAWGKGETIKSEPKLLPALGH